MFSSYFFLEFLEILDLWVCIFHRFGKVLATDFPNLFPYPHLGAPVACTVSTWCHTADLHFVHIFSAFFFHLFYFVMSLDSLIFSSTVSALNHTQVVFFISRCLICFFKIFLKNLSSCLYFFVVLNIWNIFITILTPCPVLPSFAFLGDFDWYDCLFFSS